ncbi:hypothetical protein F0L74_04645 [Chitinophaga agrisoli]|uniref:Outer membrane beta-barrel porin/alpha-amylase n=1 Tax=Chitinophaga agrisoli TaxID=2607653 RepID=A0A5B2W3X9_9BACT|nr:hypothetical protein [Chitinophaga agrisoli]KAA2245256.1 hypothetical protein F0L74_04645 [Chitinophaga agrisoli]
MRIHLSGHTTLLLLLAMGARAQMPADGFPMQKGEICVVAAAGQSRWTDYWEGKRLRDNPNIGRFTSTQISPMLGWGISQRLNVFAALPYISNTSNAGTMAHKKGWQDFSMDVKYRFLQLQRKGMRYSAFANAGFSVPASSYVPDFLPYSIGLGAKTAHLRLINHLQWRNRLFTTIQTGYTAKSKITVDRSSYYNDGWHYSHEMPVPDVWDGAVHAGYDHPHFRADAHFTWSQSTSGSDIRRYDMPYPFNRMNMTTAGVYALWRLPGFRDLAVIGNAEQTLSGRNVGKAFAWMGGLQYVFTLAKKDTDEK